MRPFIRKFLLPLVLGACVFYLASWTSLRHRRRFDRVVTAPWHDVQTSQQGDVKLVTDGSGVQVPEVTQDDVRKQLGNATEETRGGDEEKKEERENDNEDHVDKLNDEQGKDSEKHDREDVNIDNEVQERHHDEEEDERREQKEEIGEDQEEEDKEGEEKEEKEDSFENTKEQVPAPRKYTLRTSPYIYLTNKTKTPHQQPVIQSRTKYVRLYIKQEKTERKMMKKKDFSRCLYNACEYTDSYEEADAVVFFENAFGARPLHNVWKRSPTQRWVFKTMDPIIINYNHDNDRVRSQFNWTSTYKMDSDLPTPSSMLTQRKKTPRKDYGKIFSQKTKLAAWFVSHCHTWSRREEYVARMSKIAKVDIFGRCGNLTCGTRASRVQADRNGCFSMLTDDYKFYLAFENSFCLDYVTEKVFKIYGDVEAIPVVRGGVEYHGALPRGTFVDAKDFKTPEDLMRYLVKLGNNETEYTNMLRKKNKWRLDSHPENYYFCQLCKKLHTDQSVKYYKDIHQYLNRDPHECWSPQDLGPEYAHMDFNTLKRLTLHT